MINIEFFFAADLNGNHVIKEYRRKTGSNVSGGSCTLGKLECEVEKAKRALSSPSSRSGHSRMAKPSETLTRAKFDELNMDPFRKTLKPVEQVLRDSDMKKDQTDDVVLVAGSIRIPKVV